MIYLDNNHKQLFEWLTLKQIYVYGSKDYSKSLAKVTFRNFWILSFLLWDILLFWTLRIGLEQTLIQIF